MNLFTNHKCENLFAYEWKLANGFPQSLNNSVKPNNYKAFGAFIAGGGTSMGAKLASFNHLGGVEFNKKIADLYDKNLKPKYLFTQDIREFNKTPNENLPEELFNLDILEGSPPCKTFSHNGLKQKSFGVKKKFNEGGNLQTLDNLVFEYAFMILKLLPKVFIFENVKGFNSYFAKNHKSTFKDIVKNDYSLFDFCLNACNLGLPQNRERVFIIGVRKDLNFSGFFTLDFKENLDNLKASVILDNNDKSENLYPSYSKNYDKAKPGDSISTLHSVKKLNPNKILPCVQAKFHYAHPLYKRFLNPLECFKASSIPLDYDFNNNKHLAQYVAGMCVPPLVAANIFHQIKIQILDNLKD